MHVCMMHICLMHMSSMRMNACMYAWCIKQWGGWNFVTDGRIDARTRRFLEGRFQYFKIWLWHGPHEQCSLSKQWIIPLGFAQIQYFNSPCHHLKPRTHTRLACCHNYQWMNINKPAVSSLIVILPMIKKFKLITIWDSLVSLLHWSSKFWS